MLINALYIGWDIKQLFLSRQHAIDCDERDILFFGTLMYLSSHPFLKDGVFFIKEKR